MNLANQLTMLRIALAAGVFVALMRPGNLLHILALILFIAALITDWIDGYVARRTRSISAFGKVADPIADKILVLGTLTALIRTRELAIPLWGLFLIIARELLIGGLRILSSSQGHIPGAEPWGKWKMGVQSGALLIMLGILLLRENGVTDGHEWILNFPYYLTALCVIAAWTSAWFYFQQSRKMLQKSWG